MRGALPDARRKSLRWTLGLIVLVLATTPVRILGRVLARSGEDLALTGGNVFVHVLVSPSTGWLLGWVVYGSAILLILHRLYPENAAEYIERSAALKVGIGTTTVLMGMTIERQLVILEVEVAQFTGSPLPPVPLTLAGIVLALGTGVIVTSLMCVTGESPIIKRRSSERVFTNLTEGLTPRSHSVEMPAHVRSGLRLLDALIAVSVVTVSAGLIAIGTSLLFPVVELLVLVAVPIGLFAGDAEEWVSRLDLQHRFLTGIEVVRHGPKGIVSLFLILSSVTPAFASCVFSVTIVLALVPNPVAGGAAGLTPSEILLVTPFAAASFAYGWYSLWYWLQIVARLPEFLSDWKSSSPTNYQPWNSLQNLVTERPPSRPALNGISPSVSRWGASLFGLGRSIRRSEPSEPSGSDRKTRPPGLVLQPTLLLFVIGYLLLPEQLSSGDGISLVYGGVLYVVSGAFLWWMWRTIRWTHATPPQTVLSDNVALPVAHVVQLEGYVLLLELESLGEVTLKAGFHAVETMLVGALGSMLIFYGIDILRMAGASNLAVRRCGAVASFLWLGAGWIVLKGLVSTRYATVAVSLIVLLALIALLVPPEYDLP